MSNGDSRSSSCPARVNRCLTIGLTIISFTTLACAPNIYVMWNEQIRVMHGVDPFNGVWHTKDDISLLLGSPPTTCDPVKSDAAEFGFIVSNDNLVVNIVLPGSAAALAGLHKGERVTGINGTQPADSAAVRQTLREWAQSREAIVLTTDSGSYTIVPRVPFTEQCYWNISSGDISRTGVYGGWAEGGGNATASAVGYSRFYKLTCRFQDGWLASYASNWQW